MITGGNQTCRATVELSVYDVSTTGACNGLQINVLWPPDAMPPEQALRAAETIDINGHCRHRGSCPSTQDRHRVFLDQHRFGGFLLEMQ